MEKCDEKVLWLDYKNITKVVQTGSHIYIDDGLISLKVKEVGKCTENNHLRGSSLMKIFFIFLVEINVVLCVCVCLKAMTS